MSSRGHNKSSTHKNDKSSSNHKFEDYRQLAPQVTDDSEILEIMKACKNDHDKILEQLQNLWFGIPDRLAQTTEWVQLTKDKPKKSSADDNKNKSKTSNKSGKSEPKGEKRNNKEAPRSNTKPAASHPAPKANAFESNTSGWGEAAPAESTAAFISSVSVPAWGSGMSLAQKLKQQELEKQLRLEEEEQRRFVEQSIANTEVVIAETTQTTTTTTTYTDIETVTTEMSYLSHNDIQSSDLELANVVADLTTIRTEQYSHEEIEAVESTQINDEYLATTSVTTSTLLEQSSISQTTSEEVIGDSYLKLGRWDTAQQNTPFQFGNFGKDVSSDSVQSSSWAATGIDVQSEQSSTVDYASSLTDNTAAADSALASALFSKNDQSGSKFDQKPPGLGEPAKQVARNAPVTSNNTRKVESATVSSPQVQPSLAVPPAYGVAGYSNAPPGINVRGPQAMPPYYGYEQQYVPYAPIMAPGIPSVGIAAASSTVPSTTSSSSTPSTQQTGQSPVQQQPQQQPQQQSFAPPPYQYFGNPYMQPYFYQNPQMQGFYGQGRGMYQAPRGGNVYGTDPYTGTPMYGDMYSQQAQYGDLNSTGYTQSNTTPNATTGGKTAKNNTTTAPNSAPIPDNYYGNPYNNRGDIQAAAWQYQQNPAVWAPSMMGYPNQMQNFGQPQQNPSTQRDNSVQRPNNGPTNGNYGQSTFNGRNTGTAASSSTQSATTW